MKFGFLGIFFILLINIIEAKKYNYSKNQRRSKHMNKNKQIVATHVDITSDITHSVLNRHPLEPLPPINKLQPRPYHDPTQGLHTIPMINSFSPPNQQQIPIEAIHINHVDTPPSVTAVQATAQGVAKPFADGYQPIIDSPQSIHYAAPEDYVDHIVDHIEGPVIDTVLNGKHIFEHHINHPPINQIRPPLPQPGPHIIDPSKFVNHEAAIATHEYGWQQFHAEPVINSGELTQNSDIYEDEINNTDSVERHLQEVVGDEYNDKSQTNSIKQVRSKASKSLLPKLSNHIKYDTKNPHKKNHRYTRN